MCMYDTQFKNKKNISVKEHFNVNLLPFPLRFIQKQTAITPPTTAVHTRRVTITAMIMGVDPSEKSNSISKQDTQSKFFVRYDTSLLSLTC